MRVPVVVASLVLAASLLGGCAPAVSVTRASSDSSTVRTVGEDEGRVLADSLAEHLIAGEDEAVYDLMNAPCKSQYSRDDFDSDFLFALSGKPVAVEYKWNEVGTSTWPDGSEHPLRKYWYALTTERFEPGEYFLFVEVIPEGGGPVCNQFSVVAFTNGVPEQLQ